MFGMEKLIMRRFVTFETHIFSAGYSHAVTFVFEFPLILFKKHQKPINKIQSSNQKHTILAIYRLCDLIRKDLKQKKYFKAMLICCFLFHRLFFSTAKR